MKNPFPFCPNCKSKNVDFKEDKRFSCKDCPFIFYHNIASAIAVVFQYKNKILTVRRNENPQKGKLDFPGGFVDPKESAEAAAVREINEELHLNLEIKKLKYKASFPNTYEYKNISYYTLDLYYIYNLEVDIKEFNKNEIQSLEWFSLHEINIEEFAFSSHKQFLKNHTKELFW